MRHTLSVLSLTVIAVLGVPVPALAQMGFDQERTTHHFLLRPDGGIIRVDANTAADHASTQAIRTHLRRIARDFAAGRFDAPVATHAEEPDGTAVMRALASRIRYAFEETPAGAMVRIASADPNAVAAIHEFLRYQIREHHTGDPTGIHR
jgi:hypothetical protein